MVYGSDGDCEGMVMDHGSADGDDEARITGEAGSRTRWWNLAMMALMQHTCG
jgi:hypothetical protein